MVAKARNISVAHMESFRAAVAAGVNIAMGTDSAVGPHGGNLREPALMVEGGHDPARGDHRVDACAGALLRRDHEFGTLEAGSSPTSSWCGAIRSPTSRCLADPERIRLVLKGGVAEQCPAAGLGVYARSSRARRVPAVTRATRARRRADRRGAV